MSFLCFFFFKQKTAYEVRISDWSSGVCSSDLVVRLQVQPEFRGGAKDPCQEHGDLAADAAVAPGEPREPAVREPRCTRQPRPAEAGRGKKFLLEDPAGMDPAIGRWWRSVERRGGQEGVSTVRSGVWPEL